MGKTIIKAKEKVTLTRDGLPEEAFAMVSDSNDPGTWHLPHHRKSVSRAAGGKQDIEKTVDWELMPPALAALSPRVNRPRELAASPGEILSAAGHLASHYRQAGRPLPDALAALL